MPHRRTTTFRLALATVAIVLVVNAALSVAYVGYLERVQIRRVQESVRLDLNSAREVYRHRIEGIERSLRGAALDRRLAAALDGSGTACDWHQQRSLAASTDLDLLALLDREGRVVCCSNADCEVGLPLAGDPVVAAALQRTEPVSGSAVILEETLRAFDPLLAQRARISLVPTPAALPSAEVERRDGLCAESAVPVRDAAGRLVGLLFGAILLNGRDDAVDAIRDQVFQGRTWKGRDTGTATIFLGDTRIATTVRDDEGRRATGTRISAEVAEQVLGRGEVWADRAFVVNDWYLTAYEPIRDPAGRIAGALYVGLLEAPFQRQRLVAVLVFLAFVAGTSLASLALLISATRQVLRPIGRIVAMSQKVVAGDLTARVGEDAPGELGRLCRSIDEMAEAMAQRQARLEELTRAQLLQSDRLASIGRLAAGIAHEINNPLTGVLTFAHLLKEKPHMNAEDQADLDVVCKETTRVRDIVRGLLDFARESPSQREALDFNQLVRETAHLLRNQKTFRSVSIREDLDPALGGLMGDKNQLKQVLLNLMLNACEAMPKGGDLQVRTRAEGAWVRLEVQDSGHGIPARNFDRIFDPFFTTKPPGKGTGLGLSVTYGIVQRHGGTIAVASLPEQGSTFTVRLPRTVDDEQVYQES